MTVQQDREQLFLELINRDRLDPAAAGALYGVSDLSSGTGTTITTAAKQPLAYNQLLYNSATGHNQYLIANDLFSHTGSGGSTSNARMVSAGYGASGTFGSGENLAWTGSTGTYDANAQVYVQHQNLFQSAGHRKNMLNPLYEEIGVSALTDANYQGYNAMVSAYNFAYKTTSPVFVTGVHYTDTDNNNFYSIGESNAGRTVNLYSGTTLLSTTTTAAAGGYQLQTPANGVVEIVFSGGGLTGEKGASFTLGTVNSKVDLTDSNTIESNISVTLTRTTGNLTLLGIDNVNGTGNDLNNIITGNKGSNTLVGAGGVDSLNGGDGNDILNGGTGNDAVVGGNGTDTVQFSDNFANYAFNYNSTTQTYTVYGADGSIDTVTGVETFQFADVSRTPAQLPITTGAPTRAVSATIPVASQNEGNTGTTVYTFEVRLNAAAFTSQTVNYAVAGSGVNAASAGDFSGLLTGSVTFAAGETVKFVTVTVVGDTAFEQNETFNLTLSGQSSGLTLGTAAATATIVNDDSSGPPVVNGTSNADVLLGVAGVEIQNGLDGDDTLVSSAGADYLNGDAGTDTAYYYSSVAGVSVNLTNGTTSGGEAEGDTLTSIENVIGSDVGDDQLTGSSGNNFFNGYGGDDTLHGGLGNDSLWGGIGNDTLFGEGGFDYLVGGEGIDTADYSTSANGVLVHLLWGGGAAGDALGNGITGVENVIGSVNGNDTIYGDNNVNVLSGLGGDDILVGFGGADILAGGDGNDTINYLESSGAVNVSLLNGTGSGGDAAGDTLSDFENILGSQNHGDTLQGSNSGNLINGFGGNDTIEGLGGNDTLYGGTGADTFVYSALGFGYDVIGDFTDGADLIRFDSSVATSTANLSILQLSSTSVWVGVGDSGITVNSASALTLDASDFLFV